MLGVGLRQVLKIVVVGIEGAGSDLVQQRLPDVGAAAVDEGDVGVAPLAEFSAEASGQLKAACAAAHDDNSWTLLLEFRFIHRR